MEKDDSHEKLPRPSRSTVLMLFGTIGDTTWRMFIPTIGCLILGLIADKTLHTTPWIMTVGIVAGVFFSYILVKRQLNKVKDNDK